MIILLLILITLLLGGIFINLPSRRERLFTAALGGLTREVDTHPANREANDKQAARAAELALSYADAAVEYFEDQVEQEDSN